MWRTGTWPATRKPAPSTWTTLARSRWMPTPPWPACPSRRGRARCWPCGRGWPARTTGAGGTSAGLPPTTCSMVRTCGLGVEFAPGSEDRAAEVGEDLAGLGEEVVAVGLVGGDGGVEVGVEEEGPGEAVPGALG